MVADTIRTSIRRETFSPMRRSSPSWITRSSLACARNDSSPTSSSSSVPECASSNTPTRSATAPVNAPRAWPKSSDSTRSSGSAAQLSVQNGRSRRGPPRWTARATSSLPLPLSPFDQHGERGVRRPLRRAPDLGHRRAHPQQIARRRHRCAQPAGQHRRHERRRRRRRHRQHRDGARRIRRSTERPACRHRSDHLAAIADRHGGLDALLDAMWRNRHAGRRCPFGDRVLEPRTLAGHTDVRAPLDPEERDGGGIRRRCACSHTAVSVAPSSSALWHARSIATASSTTPMSALPVSSRGPNSASAGKPAAATWRATTSDGWFGCRGADRGAGRAGCAARAASPLTRGASTRP